MTTVQILSYVQYYCTCMAIYKNTRPNLCMKHTNTYNKITMFMYLLNIGCYLAAPPSELFDSSILYMHLLNEPRNCFPIRL